MNTADRALPFDTFAETSLHLDSAGLAYLTRRPVNNLLFKETTQKRMREYWLMIIL